MSSILAGKVTKQQGNQSQQTSTDFRPQDLAAIEQQLGRLQGNAGQLTGLTGQLQQQAAQQGAPKLFTGYQTNGPIQAYTPGGIDALGRQQVAQGTQALQQQAGAQAQAVQRQFAGQPGIAQALARQAAAASRLQSNPLLAQAAAQSADRGFNTVNQQLQVAQQGNQAQLQQAQASQANRAEQLGYGQAGFNVNQSLLSNLSQLGQQLGVQNSSGSSDSSQRSGGIAQNFGLK